MDMWLDNLMCNVPEVVMCYHFNGIVKGYESLQTADLPSQFNFDAEAVTNIAQDITSFLHASCTREGHTYWLYKGEDDDVVRLYDLTILLNNHSGPLAGGGSANGKPPTNPFAHSVALLLYRIASRMLQLPSNEADPRSVERLLTNAQSLVDEENYPQLAAALHYLLTGVGGTPSAHATSGAAAETEASSSALRQPGGNSREDWRRPHGKGKGKGTDAGAQRNSQRDGRGGQQVRASEQRNSSGEAAVKSEQFNRRDGPASAATPMPQNERHQVEMSLEHLRQGVEWLRAHLDMKECAALYPAMLMRAASLYSRMATMALAKHDVAVGLRACHCALVVRAHAVTEHEKFVHRHPGKARASLSTSDKTAAGSGSGLRSIPRGDGTWQVKLPGNEGIAVNYDDDVLLATLESAADGLLSLCHLDVQQVGNAQAAFHDMSAMDAVLLAPPSEDAVVFHEECQGRGHYPWREGDPWLALGLPKSLTSDTEANISFACKVYEAALKVRLEAGCAACRWMEVGEVAVIRVKNLVELERILIV
jgi:hypothetical protein